MIAFTKSGVSIGTEDHPCCWVEYNVDSEQRHMSPFFLNISSFRLDLIKVETLSHRS